MGTSKFQVLLAGFTFSATSKVAKLLKSGKATDLELANACTMTKAYKESNELAEAADNIIHNPKKVEEPAIAQTRKRAEPRS